MSGDPSDSSHPIRIVVLYCQRVLAAGANLDRAAQGADGFELRPVALPCTSKIEVSHLIKILEQGADGVQVVGCPDGQCQFLVGDVRTEKRVEHARAMLVEADLGGERLGMERGAELAAEQIVEMARRRARAVAPLGGHPMRKAHAP
jgi:coenzyme F420-reducing hydrogenase delta subunit